MYILVLIIGLLFLSSLMFSVMLASKLKKAKAEKDLYDVRISELNKSITSLIRDSHIDVYVYDELKKELYQFSDGEFKVAGFELVDIERRIHPDDANQYYNDYSDIIYGRKESLVSLVRIYNPETKRFEEYEHVINALKYDSEGKATRYMYTKRNTTQLIEEDIEKNRIAVNMHLALRGGNLMSWSFDTDNKMNKVITANNEELNFHIDEFRPLIHLDDREKFDLLLSSFIEHQLTEQQLELRVALLNPDSYTRYLITAMSFSHNNHPLMIFGVWKDLSEIEQYQTQLNELQMRMAVVHTQDGDSLMRKCD